ncbi:MAG: indole-3-glycerol phosphate synthase TrpC, partial [Thermoguttaceae bacterium]
MSKNILSEIAAKRRHDYAGKTHLLHEYKSQLKDIDRNNLRGFHKKLQAKIETGREEETPAIIAEIKRASPAKGVFAPNLDAATTAREYEHGGAACVSVLTEPHYFHGSLDDLDIARKNTSLPVLRKEFIVDEIQIYESALHTDAI